MLGQAVVVATEAEDEIARLPDVDAVPDVLEEEGETFAARQRRHVALGQRQVSADKSGIETQPKQIKKYIFPHFDDFLRLNKYGLGEGKKTTTKLVRV